MKRYFLVRHGETDLNVSGVFYGHTDCPLNEKGRAQAAEVGDYLADVVFDTIYCSPLNRALTTKEIVLGKNKRQLESKTNGREILDERLKELSCGRWENKTISEIKEMDPAYWDVFMNGWPEAAAPEGESFLDFFKRMKEFFTELPKDHSGEKSEAENILIVGHHGSIGLMLLLSLGLEVKDYWKFRIEQGVYSVISENQGCFCLEKINSKAFY